MCVTCGCGMVDEDHGDERNLTMEDMRQAAEAAGISVQEVVQNVQRSVGSGNGQGGLHTQNEPGRMQVQSGQAGERQRARSRK